LGDGNFAFTIPMDETGGFHAKRHVWQVLSAIGRAP
jgi:hypothetical protein